jgi:predicted peroxiredoxin
MDFVKMMEARGINLGKLSDYEFAVLLHAISQEKERRARVKREQLIAEYADKISHLIEEISEEGLAVYYCGSPIDLQEVGSQLVVGSKDD